MKFSFVIKVRYLAGFHLVGSYFLMRLIAMYPPVCFSLIVYNLSFSFSSPVFLFVAAQKIAPILMVSVNRISSFCLSSSHSFFPCE